MPTTHPFLLYGATGYTGRLLARAANERGLRPILCGRDEPRLAAMASELGLEYRVARLDDGLDEALRGVQVVLHAAGPFSSTCRPMVDACLRVGVHYLDLSGEVAAIEGVFQRGAEARRRGVMLMPGAGFDVVPSDCLALHLSRQVRGARRLVLGISGLETISRGSFRTLAEGAGQSILIRRGGNILGIVPGSLERELDFGSGPRPSLAMSWGDVSSAYYSTGIPDIEVYCDAIPALRMMVMANRWFGGGLASDAGRLGLELQARALPDGPTGEQRAGRQGVIVAEVEDAAGRRLRGRLRTPEAYGFSCTTALALVERVLAGDLETGAQTPARVYGPDFVLSFAGVLREEF
ncbi:saccharopine dehydrogenase family protein [Archangium lansingense]|uniref:Saccharopine dehydrogenase NADP-binding domain-containing protein n=1 Tax=Archangium lansingense TaxID=2995310 RepID=A0ABT4AH78_9BACT|nr:saccharopine dehydrogenase NADP-binding domain-containing protein [Archangium lansinium]MCY1080244.1 saccharopine dehydrogenase NADP-binding domain-containing protein [Archangium lansinium]